MAFFPFSLTFKRPMISGPLNIQWASVWDKRVMTPIVVGFNQSKRCCFLNFLTSINLICPFPMKILGIIFQSLCVIPLYSRANSVEIFKRSKIKKNVIPRLNAPKISKTKYCDWSATSTFIRYWNDEWIIPCNYRLFVVGISVVLCINTISRAAIGRTSGINWCFNPTLYQLQLLLDNRFLESASDPSHT